MNQQVPPIIIIKKKGGHGGHHGGAWKVAYADFVTAMMALFIVLWLMNASIQVRKAISAYFRDPSGTGQMSGSSAAGTGEALSVSLDNMDKLKDRLEEQVKKDPELASLHDYVQMSVTGEGLRIELLESEGGTFFQSGSSVPTALAQELILRLNQELSKLPNRLVIEGHTDDRPYSGRKDYSNWELSADRANAARRMMEEHGLPAGRITEIRGFADQNLRDRDHPDDARNRRVSVIVRYQNAARGDSAAPAKEGQSAAADSKTASDSKKGSEKDAKPAAKEPEPAPSPEKKK